MSKDEIIAIGNKALDEQFEVGQISEFKNYFVCQIIPKGADLSVATGSNCLKIQKSENKVSLVSINELDMKDFIKIMD